MDSEQIARIIADARLEMNKLEEQIEVLQEKIEAVTELVKVVRDIEDSEKGEEPVFFDRFGEKIQKGDTMLHINTGVLIVVEDMTTHSILYRTKGNPQAPLHEQRSNPRGDEMKWFVKQNS